MRLSIPIWPLLVGPLAACAADYEPRVICHNSNCVEPANPDEDDTIESLEASLAAERNGRPVFDGVEIDTFWFGAEDRCIFAHDLVSITDVPAIRAAEMLNATLSERATEGLPLTRSAEVFSVFIELKGHVGLEDDDLHDPGQRMAHADCALDLATSISDSAAANDYAVEIVFSSFEPALLTAVSDHSETEALRANTTVRLAALQGIPKPLDGETRPLDAFPADIGIDVVDVHPQWVTEAELQAYATRDWSLAYWMFSIVPETLDAIEHDRPEYVTTSEATAFARWLDR